MVLGWSGVDVCVAVVGTREREFILRTQRAGLACGLNPNSLSEKGSGPKLGARRLWWWFRRVSTRKDSVVQP